MTVNEVIEELQRLKNERGSHIGDLQVRSCGTGYHSLKHDRVFVDLKQGHVNVELRRE